jgi:hypothetical protein
MERRGKAIGWTEVRAVWNKHSARVAEAITELEGAFPFTLKGLSTDNGSEFMNEVVVGALGPRGSRKSEIFVTRVPAAPGPLFVGFRACRNTVAAVG